MNRPVGSGVDGPLKRSYLEDFWCFAVSLRKEFSSCRYVWPRHGRQGGGIAEVLQGEVRDRSMLESW
jgi:hypothetical protein